jgi:hypothetical protein
MKNRARQFLKSELVKRDLNYVKLAKMMNEKGFKENGDTLRTKINRGTFSFYFFLEVCETIGLDIKLEDKS